jgi:predicted Zn finger-like uncharacterized protein
MLLTTCPKCSAAFKVSTDQLNSRSGRVMCGRCRHVFNAFESLERVDSTFGEFDVFSNKEAPPSPSGPRPSAPPPPSETAPVLEYDPEFDAGPKSTPLTGRSGSLSDLRSLSDPLSEPFSQPLPNPASTPAIDSPPSLPPAFLQSGFGDETIPTTNAQAPYKYSPVAPAPQPESPPSRAWGFLAFLAGFILVLQIIYMWRSEIVSRYPDLRPMLAAACDAAGCTLPWGRNQSALKVESSDLIEELNRRGRFLLTATIANRAPVIQDYPHIEVSLTDTGNQTLVRRVLSPAQYLGRAPERGEGMEPNSVTQINVRLESTAANAAGYHVELFYP